MIVFDYPPVFVLVHGEFREVKPGDHVVITTEEVDGVPAEGAHSQSYWDRGHEIIDLVRDRDR